VNNEFERISKEVVAAQLNIPQHFSQGSKENNKNLRESRWSPGQYLNLRPTEM
jgi:hypothetical protein